MKVKNIFCLLGQKKKVLLTTDLKSFPDFLIKNKIDFIPNIWRVYKRKMKANLFLIDTNSENGNTKIHMKSVSKLNNSFNYLNPRDSLYGLIGL